MVQLYNVDCFEKIKEIADNSIELIITDPPYMVSVNTGGSVNNVKKLHTSLTSLFDILITHLLRL